jgi:hypothetical protein
MDLLERANAGVAAELPADKRNWLYSLGGVVTAVSLYSAAHITARLIASANLGEDDPLDAIFIQTLAPGYLPRQPPLYDWMLWALERVTGPGALPFQLLKYTLLTAACAFIFASARRVMKGDAFWAFLSVEALALIYQISWRFHEGFTHAVGAMCAVAAVLWAMLRLLERERAGDYALFGLIAGLGLLTVTPFAIYLGALIGAAAIQPASRAALARAASLISVAIALAVISPYLFWLAGTPEGIAAILPEVMIGEPGYPRAALTGLGRAFFEPVMYLAPLIFLYPLFFPRYLATLRQTVRLRPEGGMHADAEQLILHLTLLNIGALIVGALVFGIDRYPVHALMPLFLVTTIWLTAQARKAARSEREVRRFLVMALGVAVFAFAARCANMYVQQPVCQICRWGIPYAGLADTIKSRGFDHGRLVVYDGDLAGNLRRFFPHATVVLAGPRRYIPPQGRADGSGKTALVWETPRRPNENIARSFVAVVPSLQAEALEGAETLRVPWRHHLWKPDGYRFSQWRLLVLD